MLTDMALSRNLERLQLGPVRVAVLLIFFVLLPRNLNRLGRVRVQLATATPTLAVFPPPPNPPILRPVRIRRAVLALLARRPTNPGFRRLLRPRDALDGGAETTKKSDKSVPWYM